MMNEKKNILKDKSFMFAVKCINLYTYLYNTNKEYVISKQMLRSGTSVGANIREAQNAESSMDFIHKLAIAQKECDETMYWLELLKVTELIDEQMFDDLYKDASEILRMIKSAIITVKQKLNKL